MAYVLLIMEPRGQRETRSEAEGKRVYARMLDFAEGLQRSGVLKAAESLAGDAHATRLAQRGGKNLPTDGPFSEAKEMLGGFFLLDCASKEQALEIAARCPAAEWATVEVRETAPCYA